MYGSFATSPVVGFGRCRITVNENVTGNTCKALLPQGTDTSPRVQVVACTFVGTQSSSRLIAS